MATSRQLPLLVAAALAGCAGAGSLPGADAPPPALASATGEVTTLEALCAGQDLTVLVFWSADCPCVRRYQDRLDALLESWPADRVRIVGVTSNVGETFESALAAARARGVRLPLWRDEGGRVADAVGARSTPTIAVLDRAGAVRFLGWLDNERRPGEPGREPWLEHAVTALLAGGSAAPARTPVYGCVITKSLFQSNHGPCCSVQAASAAEENPP
jgi:hypothetical protein